MCYFAKDAYPIEKTSMNKKKMVKMDRKRNVEEISSYLLIDKKFEMKKKPNSIHDYTPLTIHDSYFFCSAISILLI